MKKCHICRQFSALTQWDLSHEYHGLKGSVGLEQKFGGGEVAFLPLLSPEAAVEIPPAFTGEGTTSEQLTGEGGRGEMYITCMRSVMR